MNLFRLYKLLKGLPMYDSIELIRAKSHKPTNHCYLFVKENDYTYNEMSSVELSDKAKQIYENALK
jgi:hypothetical protein